LDRIQHRKQGFILLLGQILFLSGSWKFRPIYEAKGVTMYRFLAAASLAALFAYSQTVSAAPPHPGRLLASNCFQCHGTDGRKGLEELAGKSSSSIYQEMKEMQAKAADQNIMNAHARGYSDNEIWLLADYFSKVTR
jgi:sulfide dehydrogenase cytochrome subunit